MVERRCLRAFWICCDATGFSLGWLPSLSGRGVPEVLMPRETVMPSNSLLSQQSPPPPPHLIHPQSGLTKTRPCSTTFCGSPVPLGSSSSSLLCLSMVFSASSSVAFCLQS